MTDYLASYNQGTNRIKFSAKTEIGAKRIASELGAYGHSIALIELDAAGEEICCISSKKWGQNWVNENN